SRRLTAHACQGVRLETPAVLFEQYAVPGILARDARPTWNSKRPSLRMSAVAASSPILTREMPAGRKGELTREHFTPCSRERDFEPSVPWKAPRGVAVSVPVRADLSVGNEAIRGEMSPSGNLGRVPRYRWFESGALQQTVRLSL